MRNRRDPYALAAELGASVVERDGGMTPAQYAISELHTRGLRIVLYTDTLAVLRELVHARGLAFDPEQVGAIALAHENFHALEHLKRVPRRRYPNRAACETAANAFAQGFFGLKQSPAVLAELLPAYVAERTAR